MFSLIAGTRNEVEKWWMQRKTKWFLALIMVVPAAAAWLAGSVQGSAGIAAIVGSDFSLIMLGLLTVVLLPLYLFMTAADSFSAEAASHTLKLTLLRPVSRAKAFAAKLLALAFIAAVSLAGGWIASLLAGLFLPGGWGELGAGSSAAAYFAAFFPMAVVAVFAALIAQWFNSSTTAVVVGILLYAALKLLPFFLPGAAIWSPFAYTGWHSLWTMDHVPLLRLLNIFVFLAAYSIIGYTAGLYRFAGRSL